mmetsp:Transcript_3597/g.11226  ORF Transcript_3597/g.11226 Transcript_3597/m.11226 type:complete len:275 (-) Transcript_3597:433-1257(-)
MVAVLGILMAISAPVFICFSRTTILSSVLAAAPSFTWNCRAPSGPMPWPRTRTQRSPAPEAVVRKKGLRPQKPTWQPRMPSTCPERYCWLCAPGGMTTLGFRSTSWPCRSTVSWGLDVMTKRRVSGRVSSWWSPACLNSSTSGSSAPGGTSKRNVFSSTVKPTKSLSLRSRLWPLWPPQKNFSSLHCMGMSMTFPGFFCSSCNFLRTSVASKPRFCLGFQPLTSMTAKSRSRSLSYCRRVGGSASVLYAFLSSMKMALCSSFSFCVIPAVLSGW